MIFLLLTKSLKLFLLRNCKKLQFNYINCILKCKKTQPRVSAVKKSVCGFVVCSGLAHQTELFLEFLESFSHLFIVDGSLPVKLGESV